MDMMIENTKTGQCIVRAGNKVWKGQKSEMPPELRMIVETFDAGNEELRKALCGNFPEVMRGRNE